MRTVTFLAIYHFSICVEDELIPAIEDALGFSVSDYSEISDIDSQHYILCWDNLPVPDNFKASEVKRRVYQNVSNVRLKIIEHSQGFWERNGLLFSIVLGAVSIITTFFAVYLAYNPPNG